MTSKTFYVASDGRKFMPFNSIGHENTIEEYYIDNKDAYNACLEYERSLKNT